MVDQKTMARNCCRFIWIDLQSKKRSFSFHQRTWLSNLSQCQICHFHHQSIRRGGHQMEDKAKIAKFVIDQIKKIEKEKSLRFSERWSRGYRAFHQRSLSNELDRRGHERSRPGVHTRHRGWLNSIRILVTRKLVKITFSLTASDRGQQPAQISTHSLPNHFVTQTAANETLVQVAYCVSYSLRHTIDKLQGVCNHTSWWNCEINK